MDQYNSNLASTIISVAFLVLCGCPASYHARDTQNGLDGERLTAGTVQREIRKGMSGAAVIEALGSPNVVTSEEGGREVWVYDRFATDVVASESGWSVIGLGAGLGNSGAGGVGIGVDGRAGAASQSQRTLTIVIKFDENKMVRDFAYRQSRF